MPLNPDAPQRHVHDSDVFTGEDRFRAFVTASSNAVYRMSADWKEMQQLDGARFIADTEDAMLGWMEKYIHPDDRRTVQNAIDVAINRKIPFDLEHRVLRLDGSLGWTHSRAVPLLAADGKISEWIGAARDIPNVRTPKPRWRLWPRNTRASRGCTTRSRRTRRTSSTPLIGRRGFVSQIDDCSKFGRGR